MCKHNRTFHIRFVIKGQAPKERPSPDYYAMTRQLYRITTLLNQIAARAHTTGHIDTKRLEETIMVHRQALLDIQKAVLLPEAMDTEAYKNRQDKHVFGIACVCGLWSQTVLLHRKRF